MRKAFAVWAACVAAIVSILLLHTPIANAAATSTTLESAPNPSVFGQAVDLKAIVESADGLAPTGTVSFRNNGVEVGQALLATIGEVSHITATGNFTCALKFDHTVACWGRNNEGQLGLGNTTNQRTPQSITGFSGIAQVKTGNYHTCALKTDGTVACWGLNNNGQLGLGNTTNKTTPQVITGLSNVASVTAGLYHTCALKSNGTVVCWGDNTSGQLGTGTTISSTTPVPVSSLSGVTVIDAGAYHTCARRTDGRVVCWGLNNFGQLGLNNTTNQTTPQTVSTLSNVAQLAAGGFHTCALTTSGGVQCWGRNDVGQLGTGTTSNATTPVALSSLASGIQAITASGNHTCSLTTGGGVHCWGLNNFGQLGLGNTTNQTTPQIIGGLSNVAELSAGSTHTCALKVGGTLACWGSNVEGELGLGLTPNQTTPQRVQSLSRGEVTLSTSVLPAGTLPLTAHYLGDTGFEPSTSAVVNHEVQAAPTTTALVTSGTPAEVATSVTLTATVTSGAGTPTGNVTFWDGGVGTGTSLGTVALDGSGNAALTTSTLAVGSHTITAAYTGDGNFAGSSSDPLTQVIQDTTPPVFATCPASFAVEATSASGAPITWAIPTATDNSGTAIVTQSDGPASGTTQSLGAHIVTYRVHDPSANEGTPCSFTVTVQDTIAPVIGTVPANITAPATSEAGAVVTFASPTATDAVTDPVTVTAAPASGSTFAIGTTTVTFTATDNAGNSSTATFSITVENATTTTVLAAAPNPSRLGQYVTLTATVTTTAGGGTPTGTVTFKDGATVLGASFMNGSGVATLTTAALPLGTRSLTAEYAGATGFSASTNSAVPHQVDNAPTATVLASAPNPSTFGQQVTLSATVTPESTLPPSGSVSFRNNGIEIGTGTLMVEGAVQVVTGFAHTCVLKVDRTASCWGMGALGNGEATQASVPQPVQSLTNIAAISAGGGHACALSTEGDMACWGRNSFGQLGVGDAVPTGDQGFATTPQAIQSLSSVTAIAAGGNHTCALKTDGTVACWGYNFYGQLGLGDSTRRLEPVQITGLTDVAAVAAGGFHTCALKTDGSVYCWGRNSEGQLGLGNLDDSANPQLVSGLSGVTALAAGAMYTCALTTDESVFCWGDNVLGQLGTGDTTNRALPHLVAGPASGTLKIATNQYHTCVIAADRTAACWGNNFLGQLGDGNTNNSYTPRPVQTAVDIIGIATGGWYTCALRASGIVHCWGDNELGQLGLGFVGGHQSTPQPIIGLLTGKATLATSTLPTGNHPLTAVYVPDTGFDPSTSDPVTQVVDPAATTTQLAFSGGSNPSVFGEQVSFSATVTSGAGTPTGDVTFWDGGVGTGTSLGTIALDGSGVATLAISTLSVASHTITAQYIGTTSFTGSTSGDLTQQVNRGATTVALVPSASSIVFGSGVTLTATVSVTAPAAGTPTGTVTFFDGAVEIGTGTLAGGVATLTTSALGGGGHSLTAVYGGDGNFTGATSAAANVTVTPAATTINVASSPNPSKFGEGVVMTATVTSSAGTPQGTVTFLLDGNAIATEALNGAGKRRIVRATLLSVGDHTISVVYNGNADHAGSTAIPVSHTVEKADTTTVLAPTTSPTLPGAPVTLTATVNVVAPGSGVLVGRVRFRAGNRFLGSADLSGNTATLTTSDIVTGDHVLTAEYLGHTRHSGSLSDGVAHSVDPRVGPEFRVNTTTAGAQDLPAIAALNGGGFVVAWSSNDQDGSGRGICAQRYDASAGTLDVEHRVNTTTTDQQSYPAIAPLLDGGYVVVWESRLQDGSGYGVYAQRYNSTGGTVGEEVRVNTTTVSHQTRPSVAGLTDGGYVVAWRSNNQDGSRYGIYAQRYDAGGATFGSETLVNTTTAGNQLDPAVTALSNAGFMIVWRSIALDGTAEGIFAQRFDNLNAASGPQIQVNTTPSTSFLEPKIAVLANGEVVVTWAALSSDNTSYNVDAQRFDTDGNATGGEFRVDTRRGGPQRQPAIAAVPGGGFIVTWASRNQDGSGYGVYAQRFDSIAQPVDVEFQVHTTTPNDQWQPGIAALSATESIVVWTSVGQDGASGGIYGQRLQVVRPGPASVRQSAAGALPIAAE